MSVEVDCELVRTVNDIVCDGSVHLKGFFIHFKN